MPDTTLTQAEEDAGAARAWWSNLTGAERSRLRRCETPTDALVLRETLALIRALGWWQAHRAERGAALAIVLSHVEADDARPVMRACGRPSWSSTEAALSEARFLRLMRVRDLPELVEELPRLIALMGRQASIADLTSAVRWWNDQTRAAWARSYYAAMSTNGESA